MADIEAIMKAESGAMGRKCQLVFYETHSDNESGETTFLIYDCEFTEFGRERRFAVYYNGKKCLFSGIVPLPLPFEKERSYARHGY